MGGYDDSGREAAWATDLTWREKASEVTERNPGVLGDHRLGNESRKREESRGQKTGHMTESQAKRLCIFLKEGELIQ